MASEVRSGNGNVSYTNNTGQNVRVVINFMQSKDLSPEKGGITITWAGVTVSAPNAHSIGRNLAAVNQVRIERQNYDNTGNLANSYTTKLNGSDKKGYGYAALNGINMVSVEGPTAQQQNMALPTEIMLRNGDTFSAICGPYNIVIIREDGA